MSFELYSEVFDRFERATSRKEKIEILRKAGDARFQEFLRLAFNESIEFDVEIPKYLPSIIPAGLNECYLHQEMSKMYRFIKDHPDRPGGFGGVKQKNILISILEGLHKDEAELLIKMLKKKLDIKFLTPSLVKEAFPNLDI